MRDYDFTEPFLKLGAETPSYVFDLDEMCAHVERVKEGLREKAEVCFAMKANPFLVGPMRQVVKKFEVCSPGEFRICERMGIPMEEIVLSGVYKQREDVAYVLDGHRGKGVYTVESRQQLEILQQEAQKRGLKISVLLRVTSGNQFGMNEEEIREVVSDREACSALEIDGLQYFSGTQKKSMKVMKEELCLMDDLIGELKENYGFQAKTLEYGPGFFVPYFQKEGKGDIDSVLREFGEILNSLCFRGKVILEMGRFLAASCGYFITSVVDKKINHEQHYALVDGGIHHVNYYGQMMAMKQPWYSQLDENGQPKTEGQEELWNICGSLCTINDLIVKQLPLRDLQLKDMLVFENVGAYSMTEGISLFLSRPLPSVYFFSRKDGMRRVREQLHTDVWNAER